MTLRTRASLAEAREGDFFTGTYTYPTNAGENIPSPQRIKIAGQALASRRGVSHGKLFAVSSLPYFDNPQWSDLVFTYVDTSEELDSDDENLAEHTATQAPATPLPRRTAQQLLETLPVGTVFRGVNQSDSALLRTIVQAGAGGYYRIEGSPVSYPLSNWCSASDSGIEIVSTPEPEPLADWELELLNGGSTPAPVNSEPEPRAMTAADVLATMAVGERFHFVGEPELRLVISDTQYMVVNTGDVFDHLVQASRPAHYIVRDTEEDTQ